MTCIACHATVPDGSHFCPGCGAPADTDAPPSSAFERRSESLLAEANLHRMRGQWDRAEARCVDVMRADPNDVHAHSLLGDIYRDQGRLEDAAQWYQMALDLNPDSAADHAKLAHVEEEQARRAAREADLPVALPQVGPAGGTQRLMGLPPTTWLRGILAVVALFSILVAVLLYVRRHERPAPVTGTLRPQVVPPTAGQPSGVPPSTSPMAGSGGDGPTPPAATRAPATPGYSDRETALAAQLARPGALSQGTYLTTLAVDPRYQRVTIALTRGPTTATVPVDSVRDSALRDSLRAAQAALAADPSLLRATVSYRAVAATGRADPVFEGDIERSSAAAISDAAPADTVAGAFQNAWWGPGLAPVPSPGTSGPGTPYQP